MAVEANQSHNAHFRSLTFAAFLKPDSLAGEEESYHSSNSDSHRPSNASSSDSSSSSYNDNSTSFSSTSHSPWIYQTRNTEFEDDPENGLIDTIVMHEGHVYSLAATRDLLFTGYDSKNIQVFKNLKDFSRFKSTSGFVKAIVITGDNRVYTGHQDGKIRIWRSSKRYSRLGTLPTLKDSLTAGFRRRRIRHSDAVSCLSLNEDLGLLYSGSWDKTIKIWRLSDSKCLESIEAHKDVINTVVVGFDDLVFTGSADGTLKVWKRELITKHVLVQVLMKQENAITALAVNLTDAVVYCGLSNGSVNFWERRKYLTHGGTIHGHRMGVLCLISAGSLLLSGGADNNICVWRRNGNGMHTCLSVLMDHEGPVKCLTAEEEDKEGDGGENSDRRWIVYSGSLDNTVKVWRVKDIKSTARVIID